MNFRIFTQPEMRQIRAPRPGVEIHPQSAAMFPSFHLNFRDQTGLRLSYVLCGNIGGATTPFNPPYLKQN
ncbi:MAG TPA: hypothetical protein DCQ12_02620 [Candidatus Cloacimonas sp.]|jgi:hypothetical protein|nr:hypothetical protein [Candidatus Cloacimonas sp.]